MSHAVYTKKQFKHNKFHFQAGDFLLGHKDAFHDKLIHFITGSRWNHAALIIDSRGTLIEVNQKGIEKSTIDKVREDEIMLIRPQMNSSQRKQILAYVENVYERNPRFSHLILISIVLSKLFRSPLILKLNNTMICSELVAHALLIGGVYFKKDVSLVTPADLYKMFVKEK